MKILVCGDRDWTDRATIEGVLDKYSHSLLAIIHGGCRGVDKMAGEWAQKNGVAEIVVPAQWGYHGRSAGPIRNRWMVEFVRPDLVLAFHGDLAASKGTADMIKVAKKAGIRVCLMGEVFESIGAE